MDVMTTVTYYAGICEELSLQGPRRITIKSPDDSQVHIKELVCNNGAFEVVLVEGLIGDELLPLECPIDMSFFQKQHKFEVGTITPDVPMHLYFKPFGSPSIAPYINCVITGECEGWTAPKTTEARQRRVGELAFHDFVEWLNKQEISGEIADYLSKPVKAFLDDHDLTFGDMEPNKALELYLQVRGITETGVRAFGTQAAEEFRQTRTSVPSTTFAQQQQAHQQMNTYKKRRKR